MILIDNYRIKELRILNLPVNEELKKYARRNRHAGNLAEIAFWMQVHNKMFYGIDFNRQKIIGNYIVDFYVRKLSLAVEIDGGSHNDKLEYDRQRDSFLNSLGIKIFHTTDFDVLYHLPDVLTELKNFIINNYEHEEG